MDGIIIKFSIFAMVQSAGDGIDGPSRVDQRIDNPMSGDLPREGIEWSSKWVRTRKLVAATVVCGRIEQGELSELLGFADLKTCRDSRR